MTSNRCPEYGGRFEVEKLEGVPQQARNKQPVRICKKCGGKYIKKWRSWQLIGRVPVKKEKEIKCPHCNKAELIKRKDPENGMYSSGFVPQPYDCPNCGREWTRDKEGNWYSHACTDREVWSPDGRKLLRKK